MLRKIMSGGKIEDGTKLTIEEAQRLKKPNLIINLSNPIHVNSRLIVDWIEKNEISILNIGGPRESTFPGIYHASFKLLAVMVKSYLSHNV